jgi:alkaline phosphatase
LNLEKATHVGLIKTTSSKEQITDSAAGATAFSIGIKTFNGAVGLDGNGQSKTTILEMLAADGYSTGLIATSGITHATPASFFAHVKSRDNYYSIAEARGDAPVS